VQGLSKCVDGNSCMNGDGKLGTGIAKARIRQSEINIFSNSFALLWTTDASFDKDHLSLFFHRKSYNIVLDLIELF